MRRRATCWLKATATGFRRCTRRDEFSVFRREQRCEWPSLTPRARLCVREVIARGALREVALRMGSRRWEALRQGPAWWDRAGPRHWAAAEPRPLSTPRAAAARRLRRAR